MKKIGLVGLVIVFSIIYICRVTGLDEVIKKDNTDPAVAVNRMDYESAIFEGAMQVDATPWRTNAGTIVLEDGSSCLFITPHTSVEVILSEELSYFDYRIHPWASSYSDGAGLEIQVVDESGNVVFVDEIKVEAEKDWEEYRVNFEGYPNAKKIRFICNGGEAKEESCDWVIIR